MNGEDLSPWEDELHLFPTNALVDKRNDCKLRQLGTPRALIQSRDSDARRCKNVPSNKFESMSRELVIAVGAKVVLLKNLWTEGGLTNGSPGTVIDVVYKEGKRPPDLPSCVIVKFDNYVGESCLEDEEKCVPVVPITASYKKYYSGGRCHNLERTQIPLRLAYASTVHRAQGRTLQKVVVDIGNKRQQMGLVFTALSRVKSLDGLLLDDYDMKRWLKVGTNEGQKFMRYELMRIRDLYKKTAKAQHMQTGLNTQGSIEYFRQLRGPFKDKSKRKVSSQHQPPQSTQIRSFAEENEEKGDLLTNRTQGWEQRIEQRIGERIERIIQKPDRSIIIISSDDDEEVIQIEPPDTLVEDGYPESDDDILNNASWPFPVRMDLCGEDGMAICVSPSKARRNARKRRRDRREKTLSNHQDYSGEIVDFARGDAAPAVEISEYRTFQHDNLDRPEDMWTDDEDDEDNEEGDWQEYYDDDEYNEYADLSHDDDDESDIEMAMVNTPAKKRSRKRKLKDTSKGVPKAKKHKH